MQVFRSKTDTCVMSTASVLGMRLCQYKISTRESSLVGKSLEILVSDPPVSMKNGMVNKHEIQLFSYFWLKM